MLNYSLAPENNRTDIDSCYREQFDTYPETRPWIDSLKSVHALRDTFVTMPNGERHHAFYVRKGSNKTALIIHGWRDCPIEFLYLGRLYERELGYNIVMPDLHGCGQSEGDFILADRIPVRHDGRPRCVDGSSHHDDDVGREDASVH